MNLIKYRLKMQSLLLSMVLMIAVLPSACAVTTSEVKALQAKASQAQSQLKISIDGDKDVSKIIPMMKQVKRLADRGKIHKADLLLDKIFEEFEKVDRAMGSSPNQDESEFSNRKKVQIEGYQHNAMEAFISRDGRFLFFNSDELDTPKTEKNIYYAKRIDDTHFKFMGEVTGINSAEVDAVPTMDNQGNFYFVSTAYYGKKNGFATVYSGQFQDGHVHNVKAHPELSLKRPGWLNMDIEISGDGQTIYATQTYFNGGGPPKKSYFFVAHLQGDRFVIDEHSADIFKHINTDDLEYAASISANELEIFFTRLSFKRGVSYKSYHATRANKNEAFSHPKRLNAITGIAEAPAITNDGDLLYFHKKDNGRFFLYVLER